MVCLMPIELPALPYAYDALQPHISAETLNFHHGKHHKAYVDNLNKLIAATDLEAKSLEELILLSVGDSSKVGIFNNAAQVWNHTFFWNSMKPNGGGTPEAALKDKIDSDLSGLEKFKEDFKTAATTQFGSGWAWLVLDSGKLKVIKTANADLPMAHNQKALLTCDVWEHAYYLDYQNRRADFVDVFLNKLVNWDFVAANLAYTQNS